MKKLMFILVPAVLGLLLLANASAGPAPAVKWTTDLDAALKQAKAEKKLVLMDFTGSDWCPTCKQLHKEVFEKKEFADYAKTKLVLVEVDFPDYMPQSKELEAANKALMKQFDIDGYPTVVVLNGDAKELHRMLGYNGKGVKPFLSQLDKAAKKK